MLTRVSFLDKGAGDEGHAGFDVLIGGGADFADKAFAEFEAVLIRDGVDDAGDDGIRGRCGPQCVGKRHAGFNGFRNDGDGLKGAFPTAQQALFAKRFNSEIVRAASYESSRLNENIVVRNLHIISGLDAAFFCV